MNIETFLQTLPIMGKGMFGIFLVTGVIIGFVYLLNYVTGKKENKSDKDK